MRFLALAFFLCLLASCAGYKPDSGHSGKNLHQILEEVSCPNMDDFRATGIGGSESEALAQARSNMAQEHFSQKLKSSVQISGRNINSVASSSAFINIDQEAALLNPQDAKLHHSKRHGEQTGVVACMSRADAAKPYFQNESRINELLAIAKEEKNPVSALAKIEEMRTLLSFNKKYAGILSVANQKPVAEIVSDLAQAEKRIEIANADARQKLMAASVACDDPKHNRIAQKLREILMKNGWNADSREPNFVMTVSVKANLEEGSKFWFARPMVDVGVTQGGKTVFSYSKSLERAGHLSEDGAGNVAYMNIEKDLEENFMNQFIEAFSD